MPRKNPNPKREITESDVERILKSAPDYIMDASEEIKDLYVICEWAKEERDTSPKRYYDVTLNEGTEEERTFTIDFQQTVNVSAYVKTYGGDLNVVRTANAKRLQYLTLDRAYQKALLALNKALGIRSRKPRSIVDYTGQIMEMFGKFYTVTDVATVMKKEYRIKVPEDELRKFYVEHRDLITKRRAEYVLYNKDFRVATETGRLEVLNQMLTEVEIKNRAAGGSNVDYCNLILRIIEQARKEVKGNELKMTIDGKIDINASLQANENVFATMRQLSINALVIGLTAAKAGLNPSVLISQLANSWYAKFNGFNNNVLENAEIALPSALIRSYDWEGLEIKSKKFIDEFTPITEIIDEPSEEQAVSDENLKKDFMLKIKAIKTARVKEDEKANPVNPNSDEIMDLKENGVILTSEPNDEEEPKHEFEVDYALNKAYKQKHNMRIKGAMRESIARHKANKEEGVENISRVEAEAKRKAEARHRRYVAKKKKEKQKEKENENNKD